jgi:hypothetical protein
MTEAEITDAKWFLVRMSSAARGEVG